MVYTPDFDKDTSPAALAEQLDTVVHEVPFHHDDAAAAVGDHVHATVLVACDC